MPANDRVSFSCRCGNLVVSECSMDLALTAGSETVEIGGMQFNLTQFNSNNQIKAVAPFLYSVEPVSDTDHRLHCCLNCKCVPFVQSTHIPANGPPEGSSARTLLATQFAVIHTDWKIVTSVADLVIDEFNDDLPGWLRVRWGHSRTRLHRALASEMEGVDQQTHLNIQLYTAEQNQLAANKKTSLRDLYSRLEESLSSVQRIESVDRSPTEKRNRSSMTDQLSGSKAAFSAPKSDSDRGSLDDLEGFEPLNIGSSEDEDEDSAFLATDDSVSPLNQSSSSRVSIGGSAGQSDRSHTHTHAISASLATSRPIGIGGSMTGHAMRSASLAFNSDDEDSGGDIMHRMREVSMSVREVSSDVFGERPEHSRRRHDFTELVRSYAGH